MKKLKKFPLTWVGQHPLVVTYMILTQLVSSCDLYDEFYATTERGLGRKELVHSAKGFS